MTHSPSSPPPPAAADAPVADGAFQAFLRTFGLLERVMQPHFAHFGISASQWAVLRTLHRAEQQGLPGLRLTDLGERLIIRAPSVTGVVDRLVRAGLVAREASTRDLRSKVVSLTSEGRRLLEGAMPAHRQQVDRVLSGLAMPEQEQLRGLLTKMWAHLVGMADQTAPYVDATPVE